MSALLSFELSLLDAFEAVYNPFFDFLAKGVSLLDEIGAIWIVLALILLAFKKTRKTGIMVSLSLIIGVIFANGVLKPLLNRPRPFEYNEAARVIVERLRDGSFPSGHAVSCTECATVLLIRDKRIGIPALIYTILVCFARLYLYMHFPSDVLGGVLIGIFIGLISIFLTERAYRFYEKKKNSLSQN